MFADAQTPAPKRVRLLHFIAGEVTGENFLDLLRSHDHSRFKVHLGTLGQLEKEDLRMELVHEGIEVLELGARSRAWYPQAFIQLVAKLNRKRIDIVHTHHFDPSVVGLSAATAARVPTRILTRRHAQFHHMFDRPWHVRLDRMCSRMAQKVIAVSDATRDVLVNMEYVPHDKVHVVHNGIDLARYRPSPESVEQIGRELGTSARPIVAMIARFHPVKGHRYLLSALPTVVRLVPDVLVVLAGKGPWQTSSQQLVENAGLENNVRFLGYRDDVPAILGAADIVAVPSLDESFGQVAIEAMAVGKPVVASRVGGLAELVCDGMTGVLVPPRNPSALAEALIGLLRNPPKRKHMGAAARRRAWLFDVQNTARGYEAVYEQVMRR